IRIGLIGCGEMGTDIVSRVAHMEGIEVGAIAERDPARVVRAAEIAWGEKGRTREAGTAAALDAAMEAGRIAIAADAGLVVGSGLIDVVVDATGDPAVGAEIGLSAM